MQYRYNVILRYVRETTAAVEKLHCTFLCVCACVLVCVWGGEAGVYLRVCCLTYPACYAHATSLARPNLSALPHKRHDFRRK